MALLTAMVWAVTFVSSKILLSFGIQPSEIFFLRFLLAYIAIIPFAPKRLWCKNVKHEMLMALLGITGGSAYFLFENTALQFTSAGNVCLLVSSTSLLIALLSIWMGRGEKLTRRLVLGSIVAFAGVALVVINDWTHVQLKIAGDILALLAALMWAFYQHLTKHAYAHYSAIFITRKVFAYGLLSIIIYFLFFPPTISLGVFSHPTVIVNLAFLGMLPCMESGYRQHRIRCVVKLSLSATSHSGFGVSSGAWRTCYMGHDYRHGAYNYRRVLVGKAIKPRSFS